MVTLMIISTAVTALVTVGTMVGAGALLMNSPSLVGLMADTGMFDLPFINGISYFVAGLGYAKVVAFLLAQCFCIIGLVWNAFKLWAGSAQVKKTCIDIGARLIIFTFLFNWYAAITMNLLALGTGIGEVICGGKDKASSQYEAIVDIVTSQIESYEDAEMANFSILKNKTITEKQWKKLMKSLSDSGMRKDKARQEKLKNTYKINVVSNSSQVDAVSSDALERLEQILKNKMALVQTAGNNTLTWEEIKEGREKYGWQEGKDYALDVTYADDGTVASSRWYRIGDMNQAYDDAIKRFNTLCKFFGVQDEKGKNMTADTYKKLNTAQQVTVKEKIGDWFSGLWLNIDGSNVKFSYGKAAKDYNTRANAKSISGFNPQYMSPGAIVKLGTLVAELIKGGDDTREFNKNEPFWMDVIDIVIWIISMLLVEFSSILIAIDYIVMILEYHIVTTISYILLPLMLFDGTKQYAMKLAGTFMAFFIRILTFTAVFYFAIDTYMQMLYSQFGGLTDPGSVQSFSHVILSCLLCIMLIKKVPQLAQTILSGSPSMGAGDAIQTARGALRGGMMGARKIAGEGFKMGRAAGKTTAMATGNTIAASKGKKAASDAAIAKAKAGGETDASALKGIGKEAGDSWISHNGLGWQDRASRFFGNIGSQVAFGVKDNYSDYSRKGKVAGIGMGEGNSTQRTSTFRDVLNAAKGAGGGNAASEGNGQQGGGAPKEAASKRPEIGKAQKGSGDRFKNSDKPSSEYANEQGAGGLKPGEQAAPKPRPLNTTSSYSGHKNGAGGQRRQGGGKKK